MQVQNWINLTNGLQAIRDYGLTNYQVMRLQSTHCEQHRWADVLSSIPDDFLFRLALGVECRVYDYGAGKAVPRAVWQGLEWVRYVLARRWLNVLWVPGGRAHTMGPYFAEQYEVVLNNRVKARLDYFKPLVSCLPRISAVTGPTNHDGNRAWMFCCIASYCGEAK